jgi:hypothetical protein
MIVYETIRVSPQDISAKWTKLTPAAAEALKSPEALSAQIMKSYSLSKDQADSDVKAWLAGRRM